MPESVQLLDEDEGLAARLSAADRAAAARVARARLLTAGPGDWDPPLDGAMGATFVGLLVLDGVITRSVRIEAVHFTELIGPGDLLRPWQGPAEHSTFDRRTGWEILEHARIAVVDEPLLGRLGRWPAVIDAFIGRAIQRSRSLAFHLGVCYMTRIDVRLLLVLWHYADRWGRPHDDGVVLPLPLDHDLLARIVGSRRAAAATALGDLQRRGTVERLADGWLLRGNPPDQLHDLRAQTHR